MAFLLFSDQATLPLSELTMSSVSDLASRSNVDGASPSFLDETNWQDHQFRSGIPNLIDFKPTVFSDPIT